MKVKLGFFILLCLVIPVLWASAQETYEIKEGAHLTAKERVYSDGEIQLLPNFEFSDQIREKILAHDTGYLTEILWEMPPLPADISNPDRLMELLINVESLEGLEYWSGGRDRMAPYIKKSRRVESSGSKNALPPLEWSGDSDSISFVQMQKDTAFGTNWYDVSLYRGDNTVLMETLNLTDLRAYTRKTQDAGGVLLQMAVIPEEDRTLMYTAVAFKVFPPIGWGRSAVSGSFNHRVSAIQAWFATAVFGPEER